MKSIRNTIGLVVAVIFTMNGCADLDVINPNEPDRARALSQASDVEALIAGTFRTWWDLQQGHAPGPMLSQAAEEVSSASANHGTGDSGAQPRIPIVNQTGYQWGYPVEDPWLLLNRGLAAIRDGLQSITEGGLEIGPDDRDGPRTQAFAKFMQGLSHGFIALMYDQGFVLDESIEDPNDVQLQPYSEVMAAARGYLAEARTIAGQNDFTIPSEWMGASYTSAELVRLAHSYEARFMAQVARTPTERDAVDWNEVLSHVDQGVTEDFGIQRSGPGGIWGSDFKDSFSGETSGVGLRFLGRADQSGGWQAWEASDPRDKVAFVVDTDDRRISGDVPESSGKYIQYLGFTVNEPERGPWFMTYYSPLVYRSLSETDVGFVHELTVEEMEFLRAEAYVRLDQPENALPIINATRVTEGELPPADENGVSGARCVPRTVTGECGDLLYTLHYEKMMETIFLSAGSSYYDSRGFGTLRTGTPLHFAVPAADLETLNLDVYTYGGPGGEWTAP